MKRIAIILDKNLNSGEVGNVSAILMGDLAGKHPEIFAKEEVKDTTHISHATIKFSTVVLKGGAVSMTNFAKKLVALPEISCVVFSKQGQSLNNEYELYKNMVETSSIDALSLVGVAVYGDEETIKPLTKKFSVMK